MKLKLLLGAIVVIVGLFFVNRWLNEKPQYRPDAPAVADTPTGEVRAKFTVGFLPVT
ncbi:MAG: hypothetical protein HZA53_17725 [Planctomycetes bacterium]|nr:hypothetical protein [Planctomycetota bacterium]